MEQITRATVRGQAVRVGVDLAKRVIQVHAVDGAGQVLATRALARDKFIAWCAQLPAGCIVAMETSSSSHHWARKLIALGLDARIIAAQLVSPYRRQGASGKNDANDAAAVCEAASRPQMLFVPVKSIEQQSMLCVHRLREGFKAERVACINRIRGLLAEFGLVFAQSPAALQAVLSDVLEDASNEMNTLARLVLQRAQSQWRELDEHMAWCDERIAAHAKDNADVNKAATLMGIGPVTASAAVATVAPPTTSPSTKAMRQLGEADWRLISAPRMPLTLAMRPIPASSSQQASPMMIPPMIGGKYVVMLNPPVNQNLRPQARA